MIPPFNVNDRKTPLPRGVAILFRVDSVAQGLFVVAISACLTSAVHAHSMDGLRTRALKILEISCAGCHTPGKADDNGFESILDPLKLIEGGLVNPAIPARSEILRRISDEVSPMPPLNAPETINRPTKEEARVLEEWIASLATLKAPETITTELTPSIEPIQASPERELVKTQFVDEKNLVENALKFLGSLPAESQPAIRFFSFRNLHQLRGSQSALNPNFAKNSALSDDRIALVKALNSLSWNSDFVTIGIVPDSAGMLLWVDLSTLKTMIQGKPISWNEEREWRAILKKYPYGYEVKLARFRDLQRATGSSMPIIRADWFISTALRPPLYHDLLQIPQDETELQAMLQFDIESNLRNGQALRIGFTESKVSTRANRLIERHSTTYGYYWKSYDFLPSTEDSQRKRLLKQFPTGPRFDGNRFTETAFEHDGGEIIFSLPNQLQAYMLVEANGTRINSAPEKLVSDGTLVSGSPSIVNGLSCIACHSKGMILPPADEILTGTSVKGAPLDFVRRFHRPAEATARLNEDMQRFLRALADATENWQTDKVVLSPSEPISRIAKNFNNGSLGLAELASELGVEESYLRNKLSYDNSLQQILPYSINQTIKREDWQSNRGLQTLFQQTIRHLELGTPWKFTSAGLR